MKLGQTCYIVRNADGHALAYVYFEGMSPAAVMANRLQVFSDDRRRFPLDPV